MTGRTFTELAFAGSICPLGYEFTGGKLPLVWNVRRAFQFTWQECANKCSEDDWCLSFQHSLTKAKCFMKKNGETSTGPYGDFLRCTKRKISKLLL